MVPGDFAALLAFDPTGGTPAAAGEAPLPSLPGEPAGRQDGKLAGKILPVALPVIVEAEPAEDGAETKAASDSPAASDDKSSDIPALMPSIILAGVPALPIMPETPALTDAAPKAAPAVAAPVVAEETNVPAPRDTARTAPDVSAVRFVQPDATDKAAMPAPETAKLVEARASTRPIADSQPRPAVEAAATSAKAMNAPEAVSPVSPIATAGDSQPAMLARDLPVPATASAQSAPLPAPRAAPHDFATLVDRLVEARDAAGAQPVSAAIAHAEFGRVSLRFHPGEGALSVAMTSADPGFAPAVAAAQQAATAQQQDNAAGQQRPEQQAQQQNGAASGQGNPQAQSYGSAAHAQGRGGDRAGQQTFDRTGDGQSETPAQAGKSDTHRRGIYA